MPDLSSAAHPASASLSTTHITANWSAHPRIQAFCTTRTYGHSLPPYAQNNLAHHVDDHPAHVEANRAQLCRQHHLPEAPQWLHQTHSTACITLEDTQHRQADAIVTRTPHRCLAVLTADCLPILIANTEGTEIAAIHAGWRGLVNGIIENSLKQLHTPPEKLMAWLGPCICAQCFEVGNEVRDTYLQQYAFSEPAFRMKSAHQWLADLPQLATLILQKQGIHDVSHSNACTYAEEEHFFSYRRDQQTGRMASIIWMKQD